MNVSQTNPCKLYPIIVGRCRVLFHDPPQPRLVDSQEIRIMDIGPRSTSPSLKYIYSGHVSRVSRVFFRLKHGYVLLGCVLHVRRKTYNWEHALLDLKATTYGFFSTQTSLIQFLHFTATSITPTQTANAVLFFGASLLPKRGRGGVGARAAAAAKMNSCRSCNSSAPGAKRNKYRNDTE